MADDKTYTKAELDSAINDAVSGLKESQQTLMDELKTLKRAHRPFEGLDPDEIKRTLKEAKELRDQKLQAEGDWEKIRDQMREDHKKELEKRDQQISDLQGSNTKMLKKSAINEAMKEARIAPQFAETVEAFLDTKIVVTSLDSGELAATVGDKPVADFLKSYVSSENGKHYVLAPTNSGGGAGGAGGPRGFEGKNPFDPKAPNITEQMRVAKENPKLAEQLKAQAGQE